MDIGGERGRDDVEREQEKGLPASYLHFPHPPSLLPSLPLFLPPSYSSTLAPSLPPFTAHHHNRQADRNTDKPYEVGIKRDHSLGHAHAHACTQTKTPTLTMQSLSLSYLTLSHCESCKQS